MYSKGIIVDNFMRIKSSHKLIKKLLQYLMVADIQIGCILFDKRGIFLGEDQHVVYNRFIGYGLQQIYSLREDIEISIIQSKIVTNKFLLSNYVQDIEKILDNYNKNVSIQMAFYQKYSGLQFVDAISRAIFQYYEKGDPKYYDIIKDKIQFLTMKNPIALTYG